MTGWWLNTNRIINMNQGQLPSPIPVRLNKYLADRGLASRREVDAKIARGLVMVDGMIAVLGQKVNGSERVLFDGQLVETVKPTPVYLLYNKPIGIICTSDSKATDNIIEAIDYPERLFHVGRLDVASSGLILMTNDGEIVNKILRSQGRHEKEYVVEVNHPVSDRDLHTLSTGIKLEDGYTQPAQVARRTDSEFSIVLIEGRNRQIRRMCEALGYEVLRLRRVRIMQITDSALSVGQWRHLTPAEEKDLLTELG